MTSTLLSAPPALSTPAEHLFDHVAPEVSPPERRRSVAELKEVYEISRTAQEVAERRWTRIALQFPDEMLPDAPAVAALLRAELDPKNSSESPADPPGSKANERRIYILADTSYSSCCVDEIAAEHVDAEAVVHYGRACLSPTSRLPVMYVFTKHEMDQGYVLAAFEKEFTDRASKVIVMADVTYQDHIPRLSATLREKGYGAVLSTEITHDPQGRIPNRKIITLDDGDGNTKQDINPIEFDVFHVSHPPVALLLVLSSRVKSLRICPATPGPQTETETSITSQTPRLLGRRYARVLSLSTAAIIGILVNTLSVSNYLSSVAAIRAQISAAGKKSYTVVVGKLNPAKLANFAEVDGWVVVGCWQSSLVEDDVGFYRPIVTPFELNLALQPDEKRVWTGEWWGGLATSNLESSVEGQEEPARGSTDPDSVVQQDGAASADDVDAGGVEGEESEPPEFDLRTGRLISHSRPMRTAAPASGRSAGGQAESTQISSDSTSLTLRPKADLAVVNGVVSPGAEFLRSQRTWTGLGSDFDVNERSTAVEEGRSGVARGYTVGEGEERR